MVQGGKVSELPWCTYDVPAVVKADKDSTISLELQYFMFWNDFPNAQEVRNINVFINITLFIGIKIY